MPRRLLALLLAVAAAPSSGQVPALVAPVEDALFAQPYVDVDEWRETPVRHRYVHGGFRGTETRFSFYLPPKVRYRGRFFQHITPTPDSENNAQRNPLGEDSKIGFALASGGYFVETNGGGRNQVGMPGSGVDPTIAAYRANAAAARYSRVVALEMYGGKRPYGYAYGGSGGGYRTIGSIENTRGVWDGVVPYVIGSTMAIPNMFSVRMHAMRLLRDKFPQIVDAVEPGGSGDPYAGLNEEQASALREVTRMGFKPQSWFGWKTMGVHGFSALYPGVVMADPGYFEDFWTKPGYYGHDHPESFAGDRIRFATTIAAPVREGEARRLGIATGIVNGQRDGGVDNAFAATQGDAAGRIVGIRLAGSPPEVAFLGGDLVVTSGKAAGRSLPLARIVGDVVVFGVVNPQVVEQLAGGDAVRVDNSNFLAAQTYHRHQVPGRDFAVWDQFRDAGGKPLYPQRPMLIGPMFVQSTAGSQMTGKFEGKMIVVESLWDREAMPWQADWYRKRVESHLGARTNGNFRLWYIDHALHGDNSRQEDPSRTVSYMGALHQALRQLAAWVEAGQAPPASTSYRIDDGQVVIPASAAARKGIQPVVTLKASGGDRTQVRAGDTVSFTGTITVPPGAGSVVAADWDFAGKGEFAIRSAFRAGARSVRVAISQRFDTPGTWFIALRGTSQPDGDPATPYARLANLGRVRVVVK